MQKQMQINNRTLHLPVSTPPWSPVAPSSAPATTGWRSFAYWRRTTCSCDLWKAHLVPPPVISRLVLLRSVNKNVKTVRANPDG